MASFPYSTLCFVLTIHSFERSREIERSNQQKSSKITFPPHHAFESNYKGLSTLEKKNEFLTKSRCGVASKKTVQDIQDVQEGKYLKINKRTGLNKDRTGGNFARKDKRTCMFIRDSRIIVVVTKRSN